MLHRRNRYWMCFWHLCIIGYFVRLRFKMSSVCNNVWFKIFNFGHFSRETLKQKPDPCNFEAILFLCHTTRSLLCKLISNYVFTVQYFDYAFLISSFNISDRSIDLWIYRRYEEVSMLFKKISIEEILL